MLFTSTYTNAANTNWRWLFGDGQSANVTTGNTVTHTYAAAQTNITVSHWVDLGQGCRSDTIRQIIPVISANPVVSFTMDTDTLCVGTPIKISSGATGISAWNWDFGNGTGNNAPPFARTYAAAGSYTVTLIGRNALGCGSVPVSKPIVINPVPLVNAGPDLFINSGASIVLPATATPPGNYAYTWTPSAGLSAANILTPTATPAATTTYKIQVADNASNCFGEDEVTVNVITGIYIPTAFTPNRDGRNDAWEIPGLALYPDAVVTIYNRYGQRVYETKNYAGRPWKGDLKGTEQPIGTYIYLIRLNNAAKQVLKGVVTIIR
jgi:gliding motility-associated-like protein